MSTLAATLSTSVVLAAAGTLPVLLLVGPSWQALPLAPLAGSVLAAVAGACSLAVSGSTMTWFVILACLASAASLAWWLLRNGSVRGSDLRNRAELRRSGAATGRTTSTDPSLQGSPEVPSRTTARIGALVIAAAIAFSLIPLRVPSTGFDARDIWLLRAGWFAAGHSTLLAAFRNHLFVIAHASYPPLVSATVAISWQLTGNHSDRLGVVIIAILNACAVASTAWVLLDAGRFVAGRAEGRRRYLVLVVSVVAACLFVLSAFAVFGQFATNGYADPLWSAGAVGAVGYGLLLPLNRGYLASSGILVAVAGLTKVEGTVTAIAIVCLLVARSILARWSSHAPRRSFAVGDPGALPDSTPRERRAAVARVLVVKPLLAGIVAIAALASWTVLTRLEHTTPDGNTSGVREGTLLSRLHLTVAAMEPHLHVFLLVTPLALVAGLLLRRVRRQTGLANDLWVWGAIAAGLLAVGGAYVTGPGDTAVWLLTSVHRTTMFPAIAAWLVLAAWAIVAIGADRPSAAGEHLPSANDQVVKTRYSD